MARLGHATPAAAMVYLHARSDRDHALTDALSRAMSGALAADGPEGSDVTNR
jgi:alkaline phosphatase